MVKSEKNGMKKGAWSDDEDNKLRAYIQRYGHWNWALLPKFAGVSRSGKSCRLRWVNYLRPNIKHGNFTEAEDNIIMDLHHKLGNKWSTIATNLPGRSDNEIKNRWNTYLKKQAQKNHIMLEDNGTLKLINEAIPQENVVETTDLELLQEVEILQARSSSSSESPSIDQLSSHSSSSWDYAIDVTQQPFVYEPTTNFWSDPFISDDDNMIISSSDHHFLTPLDLVDDYSSNAYSHEFLWSTLDLCNDSFLF